ncbi:MAG: hypothetical protein GY822_06005 [Deltaproteobacteria bacterium]|nr:hypothetical protein [Deltaproteobacteria bacterium]
MLSSEICALCFLMHMLNSVSFAQVERRFEAWFGLFPPCTHAKHVILLKSAEKAIYANITSTDISTLAMTSLAKLNDKHLRAFPAADS